MKSPYFIDEPTIISFSGGRTSAFMLWKVLQANNGLPKDAIVCFANTGKEEEATLKFVNDCSVNWNVPIVWLEYRVTGNEHDFAIVDFETASRNGEPFEALIRKFKILPNPRNKSCTAQLKIRTIKRYLHSIGITEWDAFVGIRADEPNRAKKLKGDSSKETPIAPLYLDGISKYDVSEFWKKQSFDLELPNINGTTPMGNCDLCYLKAGDKIKSIIEEKPERAVWWAKMEVLAKDLGAEPTGALFRIDRPSYQKMMDFAIDQIPLFGDDSLECFCGD